MVGDRAGLHQHSSRPRRLRPAPEVVGQRLEDVFVVVHLGTSRILELNRTAARFWELLQQESDSARIERRMLAEFDVNEPQLRDEIDRLIPVLLAEKLVSVVDQR
jgi:hypothetical protein